MTLSTALILVGAVVAVVFAADAILNPPPADGPRGADTDWFAVACAAVSKFDPAPTRTEIRSSHGAWIPLGVDGWETDEVLRLLEEIDALPETTVNA